MDTNTAIHMSRYLLTRYRPVIIKLLGSFIALLSVGTAHYIGFFLEVPIQIFSTVGGSFAQSVTTKFLFYAVACAAMARFFVHSLISVYLISIISFDRIIQIRRLNSVSKFYKNYKIVKAYKDTVKDEGVIQIISQVIIFIMLMLAFYLNFVLATISVWVAGVFLLSLFAIALRTEMFLMPPKYYLNRIKNKERKRFRMHNVPSFIVGLVGIAIFLAFFAGKMRAEYIRSFSASSFSNTYFTGYVQVFATTDNSVLLYESKTKDKVKHHRYLYFTDNYGLTYEESVVPKDYFEKIKTKD